MAKDPTLVSIEHLKPSDEPVVSGPGDDSEPVAIAEGFTWSDDGEPFVPHAMMERMMDQGVKRLATRYVIDRLEGLADNPVLARSVIDEFFYNRLGIKTEKGDDGSMLAITHGITSVLSDKPMSVLFVSSRTCDQFCGMFVTSMPIFDGRFELNTLASLATQSYIEGAYTAATYDFLIQGRWSDRDLTTRDLLRHTRAARKLIGKLIGDNELHIDDPDQIFMRLAGSVAFRRMKEKLADMGYDDMASDYIDSRRGQLILKAYRATQDEFFIGLANPLGKQEEDAYLKAAVDMITPHLV